LYFHLFGLETVSLRYFNVFGPGQDPRSEYSAVIPKFISALLQKRPITVHGDGEQSRDFTYVENVVEANILSLRGSQAAGHVMNIGCGERITLNTLIQKLEVLIGVKATVNYAGPKPGDVRHSLADISAAQRLLGYKPRVSVTEGLRRTVEAFARNGCNR
jgi:UDP-glucose 4-epimerase